MLAVFSALTWLCACSRVASAFSRASICQLLLWRAWSDFSCGVNAAGRNS